MLGEIGQSQKDKHGMITLAIYPELSDSQE